MKIKRLKKKFHIKKSGAAKKAKAKIKVKAKAKDQVKIKKAMPKTKVESQIKAKKEVLKSKLKAKIQAQAKRISPKAKVETKSLEMKQMVPKSKLTSNKVGKKSMLQKQASAKDIIGPVDTDPGSLEKNKEYMNKGQLADFRGILLGWKERLTESINLATQHQVQEASNHPDPLDSVGKEEELSVELHRRDRERKLLNKIDEALVRINNQNYGYCDDCGAEIGISRLKAHPTVTQCIECKAASEDKEKQVGKDNVE